MYDFNCLMVNVLIPSLSSVLHNVIEDEDLYINEDDMILGLELDPHVTILYGIDPGVSFDTLQSEYELPSVDDIKLNIVGWGIFKTPEYDVLHFKVDCPELIKINVELKKIIPNWQKFDDYIPHMTIAYLKPGLGEKYLERFGTLPNTFTFYPDRYEFSDINLKTEDE